MFKIVNFLSEEFGNHTPNHNLSMRRPPARRQPARRQPARKPLPKKPLLKKVAGNLPKQKAVTTKPRYSLTSDNLTLLPGDSYGRGYAQVGSGLSSSYSDPFSVSNPPPPPFGATNVKQSKANSIFDIASQVIAGWSPNKRVQTPIYNAPNSVVSKYPTNLNNDGGAGMNGGASLGGGFDGIISWASENPLIVLGVVGGLFLLFRQPPKYGNR